MRLLSMGVAAMVLTIACPAAHADAQLDIDLIHGSPWILTSGVQDGKPTDASETHKTMGFTAATVRFNQGLPTARKLSYTVDTTVTPHQMTVFNDIGPRHFVIYSCLYVVKGKKLDLTFNPGKEMPTTMTSTAKNELIELHFEDSSR